MNSPWPIFWPRAWFVMIDYRIWVRFLTLVPLLGEFDADSRAIRSSSFVGMSSLAWCDMSLPTMSLKGTGIFDSDEPKLV